MARDQGPKGELPNKHSISFVGPTPNDIDILDSLVRAGSDRKTGIKKLRMATAGLPEAFPISTVDVDFVYTKWENSPYGRDDIPHYIVGFDIETQVALKEPTLFDSAKAQQVLAFLQANAGIGFHRELPNGNHQVVIPGGEQVVLNVHTFPKVYEQSTGEKTTTLLELGMEDPQQAFKFLSALRDGEKLDDGYRRLLDSHIADLLAITDLRSPSLKVHLASNYLYSRGTLTGDNRALEGPMDRRFGLAYGDLRSDYPADSKYFGVHSYQILPYFENTALILEAICNSLGKDSLPPVVIPVRLH